MHASLDSCPALVLNADYRPLSYFPLSVWGWQDAVKAAFLDRVTILSTYDRAIRSPSMAIRLPSVVALKRYRPLARRPAFTRFNVFLRDSFTCQYCVTPFPVENLTFDHLVPRSRGGRTTWENVIAACSACNLSKGNRLPQECAMRPQRRGAGFSSHVGGARGRGEGQRARAGGARRGTGDMFEVRELELPTFIKRFNA
jgi:5-methylcytosine-specific restriction endonuclease McrA